MSTITMPTVNGKPIQFVATAGFSAKYGGIEATLYIRMALSILQKYPVDMLIFEMVDPTHLQVRLAGYNLKTDVLDEKTVAFKTKSLPIERFWFKIDLTESGEYIGTFLFPSEY
jgi:hypothetical protein